MSPDAPFVTPVSVQDVTRWQASLHLSFQRDGARTELARREHRGPLRVQRPFHPEGVAVCHVVVLHPPGGIVGGDSLTVDVHVQRDAHALLTTPAATKFYRSAGATALQTQTLRVADGACLEWLPQETIAWSGARAQLRSRVELARDAKFFGWEMLCLGRPAAAERFERGELLQRIELVREGVPGPWLIERGVYEGGGAVMQAPWGLRGQPVLGTFICVSAGLDAALVERARESASHVAAGPDDLLSLSLVRPETLVARYLGGSTERGRACFTQLWKTLRPALLGREAIAPRIWLT